MIDGVFNDLAIILKLIGLRTVITLLVDIFCLQVPGKLDFKYKWEREKWGKNEKPQRGSSKWSMPKCQAGCGETV